MKRVKKVLAKKGDFFASARSQLTPERLVRAHSKAMSEIFSIRLSKLRTQQGIAQTEVKGFTQSNVSRLETRDDMKLSTLLQYLDSIDMDVEITVKPKHGDKHVTPIKILKTG
jgi:hypothetical protein